MADTGSSGEAPRDPVPAPKSRGPGVVTIAAHFPEAVRRQLRIIAAQEGRTSQSLLGEALNDLFRKRGQLPIAPE
ncbi:MAG: hypothetical protein OXC11_16630 [Rhodospirillales bacterium]|nr:hypothetical protein [Rhodospirillales bacterium]